MSTPEEEVIQSTPRVLEHMMVHQARVVRLPSGVTHTSVEAEPHVRDGIHTVTLSMRGYVLTEKIAQDVYEDSRNISHPASPWQFFKQRHANSWWLGWLVRRRPVTWDTRLYTLRVEVDRCLAYPEAALQFSELGRHTIWEQPRISRMYT